MLHQYKRDKIQEQIDKDSENALSSLKVIPNKCTIRPYTKVPVKIQFKPVGLISNLDVQVEFHSIATKYYEANNNCTYVQSIVLQTLNLSEALH